MKLLASTIFFLSLAAVSAEARGGRIDYDRLDCYQQRLCGTQLSWRTYSNQAIVTVQRTQRNGRQMPEKLVACGQDNYKYIDWLAKGDRYVFRLYEGYCPRGQYPRHLGRVIDRVQINVPGNYERDRGRDRHRDGRNRGPRYPRGH
tara:strand:- start:764 stop:1201 length:438 start_codon:yes stop_codon:yes gene_type:complete